MLDHPSLQDTALIPPPQNRCLPGLLCDVHCCEQWHSLPLCDSFFSRMVTRPWLNEQRGCWCLPKQQMCFTSLTCTKGSGFLLSHFTFFFKIIHVLNIERGWKMTQEKVSPLFLTIKIYVQLLSVKSVKVLCSHCMGFLVQSVWWGVWDGCSCG